MGGLVHVRTDAAVAAQVTVVIAATLATGIALRRQPELRTFTTGIGVFLLALLSRRALH